MFLKYYGFSNYIYQLSVGKYYSVRINGKYRAYGRKLEDGGIEWIEINGHDYEKALRMLENMK
ncbi:hypothetical protein QA584_20295 [Anaerocolumna sp. AGMB13025]|uniref:hypothetical protein n=1 Tax=Anaerocolumna sp. AGMB13025 TaxID=3039116 RepID=UPI00241D5220|nr:hypothetical protein [Anaerocolumna sp. AGMB13025]WFR55940.1 hypothetical protein QA584_20295 [Anaerocolumna sp. AGMB13025]